MIVDNIVNSSLYASVAEGFCRAFEVLKNTKLVNHADGRYDIDGDNLFYIVQRYQTKPFEQAKLEAHKNRFRVQGSRLESREAWKLGGNSLDSRYLILDAR